ncbi:sensor histidine kinase [Psychromonas antarctica]|jgi:signal transduction histidine kinase|uniref:sensor histidine kinase n=1 Tax=Psychromonas antarctica TaxID=67573 RepID=UPI001EE8DF94|nr:HAMP domain-containing sensor histidine kinase [Psychromonas antarctica]MCG6200596.1 HAMP domain-containing histidine kinase [Psychromonas antarctica]
MNKPSELDFSTILATSAHDMKNSLFMLLQSIENLDLADNLTSKQHQAFADLHYQTSRINGGLMQLLALYRDEQNQLPIYIEEHSVAEMFQEVLDRNRLYLNSHHVKILLEVDPDLTAYFDLDLITYLIGDIFINALRHTKKSIILRAFMDNHYLNVQVDDDGEGYPDHMLAINNTTNAPFNASKGRSGLGLLFAQRIAAEHKNKQLQGHILLENKIESGGSLFTLRLP